MGTLTNPVRVVFEKGIEIRCDDGGLWSLQSGPSTAAHTSPSRIAQEYGVRPVIATARIASGDDLTMLLPINEARSLTIQHSELMQRVAAKGFDSYGKDLCYAVGSLCYHCERLAETYCEVTRDWGRSRIIQEHQWDRAIYGGQVRPYYEFDALMTAALRSYDTSRYILWRVLGQGKGSIPSSFERTLVSVGGLPVRLQERLASSWNRYGSKVKAYRDCIQHYIHVGGAIPYACVTRLKGDVWSVSCPIPDNPDVRARARFRYELSLDALTYGWEVTNELMDIAKVILDAAYPNEDRR